MFVLLKSTSFACTIMLRSLGFFFALPLVTYLAALSLVALFPALQTHVFYLHRVSLIWSKDLNIPEQFGFLKGQVTPFFIKSSDGESLHTWHVLPLILYRQYQRELRLEPSGPAADITETLPFKLLRDDPEARVVISLHGTAGCLGSGWRPESYRNLYSTAPDKIHVLAIDYRGYGLSTGTPSEDGLLQDAVALIDWTINIAGIPPDRIVIFGQSLGTAVGLSLLNHYISQDSPIAFSGSVFVAAFSDVATLTSTYRIGGTIPVLSPLARIPLLFNFFISFLTSTWLSKDRLGEYISRSERTVQDHKFDLTFIHANDDADITYQHSEVMFWHAVNATAENGILFHTIEARKDALKIDLGEGGWEVEWKTPGGVIRQQMLKYGLHDKIMSYPVVALAVLKAFQNTHPGFAACN